MGIYDNLKALIDAKIKTNGQKSISGVVMNSVLNEMVDGLGTYVPITWAALRGLRDNGDLVPGTLYRITDYVTTTVQAGTRSAGHAFDLIVLATDESTLSEDVKAIQHEGDAYFDEANLDAWEISYCLDNNDSRYVWADTENGKGVIWRMKDEWGNDCPFDFKNIMFERTSSWVDENPTFVRKVLDEDERFWDGGYFYAFSRYDGGEVRDLSLVAKDIPTDEGEMPGCHGNVLSPLDTASQYESGIETSFMLPSIVIISSASYNDGYFNGTGNSYNVFGRNCYVITLGNACYGNRFGDQCINVVFGNDCHDNTFGNFCRVLRFEDCVSSSSIGHSCRDIDLIYYVFGVTIGHQCEGIYCAYAEDIYINPGTKYVKISGMGSEKKIKYCTILPGTSGTNYNNRLSIPFNVMVTYPQFAGMNSEGLLHVWNPADNS